MKTARLIASIMTAAFLAPAVCLAQDSSQEGPPSHRGAGPGGPGGPRGEGFRPSPEVKKLLEEYKANPSEELKSKIKAKLAEGFDKHLKERTEQLQKEKERLDSLQSNRDKEINSMLEKFLSGKPDDQKDQKGKKPQHND